VGFRYCVSDTDADDSHGVCSGQNWYARADFQLVSLIVTCYYGLLLADLTDLSTLAHSEL